MTKHTMTAKQYDIPVVSGYFSAQSSLLALTVLHDMPFDTTSGELQLYFNDLYQVFMHRITQFAITDTLTEAEEDKLTAMFSALLEAKRALREV